MDINFTYFIFILISVVVGVIVIKKITGCLIKTAILAIVVGILAYIYFAYFRS